MQRKLFKLRTTIVAAVATIFALSAPVVTAQQASYSPVVGKMHADFELPSIDENKMVKLSDFRGKKLLLFHFASW